VTREFDEITLEQVATFPRPGTAVPGMPGFTPDGSKVVFLHSADGSLVRSLWSIDLATGERSVLAEAPESAQDEAGLSREEQLRRERARLRETGVTSYGFANAADPVVLLVPLGGKLFVKSGDGPLEPVEGTDGALDAKLSADGTRIGFVRGDELHVADLGAGEVRRLTHDAEDGLTNGVAEFIAHEELGRGEGFWIGPDGESIAYAQADSRHVPCFPIVHQGTPEPEVEEHRYPFAGADNAKVRLGVVPAAGGETVWMDLGDDWEYLARVAWRPEGDVAALLLSRDQKRMEWRICDPATGTSESLLGEGGNPWLNLDNDTRFLESGEILRTNEAGGFKHLQLLGEGFLPLTGGEWMVTGLLDVDEERRIAYFTATKESVLERHVYSIGLDDGAVSRITEEPGWHQAVFSPDHRHFVDITSSLERGYRVAVRSVDGAEVAVIHEDPEATAEALGLAPPRLVTLEADDGTTLHGALYEPVGGGDRPPAIVSVYGGPHAQRVMDEWLLTVDLRAQYLARKGFLVFKLDNRGSANRGLAFEGALNRRFGTVEVDDQVAGVRWLVENENVDPDRVGVFGWSYGGYMTLMTMLRAPDMFRVGVSGAPVTDWDGYDTGYTERYMGTPEDNPDGYREGSVLPLAGNLEGKLLLIHGMVDENVHFRHTARLLVELGKARKTVDLLTLPEERHMPRDKQGLLDLERRVTGYFEEHL
jgi:dipeptidyl-peptidase-4